MIRTLPLFAAAAAMAATTLAAPGALAAPRAHKPAPMPAVRAKMKAVVDPASSELFNLAGAADPENGPDQTLPDTAGWAKLKTDADGLKDVAEWMRKPANGPTGQPAWMKAASAMASLSAAASKAAAAHDPKALAKAANDLSDTCTACHSVYKAQQ
jgi:hypothetical protein